MSDEKKHDDGIHEGDKWPAFPQYMQRNQDTNELESGWYWGEGGLTPRQHAAIELRVPDSGLDWLDEMITKARRMDFAGQALISEALLDLDSRRFKLLVALADADGMTVSEVIARECYVQADDMIAEKRRRGAGDE